MPEEFQEVQPQEPPVERPARLWFRHGGLFLLTFASVSYAGVLWVGRTGVHSTFWGLMIDGALFATLLLGFLGTHEFGHYFAARWHRVKASLPYFIPVPFLGIGTLGAVIRIQEPIRDTRKLFDIGIAGPLAGFVVALALLLYGFITLPGPEYIFEFEGHSAIKEHVQLYGTYPENPPADDTEVLVLGNTLLFGLFASMFPQAPPMWEMYHYPFLFAGWLGLFFTALNLTPVGQLDGGHILYGLVGRTWHKRISNSIIFLLSLLGGIGAMGSIMSTDPFSLGGSFIGLYWIGWALALIVIFKKIFNNKAPYAVTATIASLVLTASILWFGMVSNPESFMMWLIWLIFLTFFAGAGHPPVMVRLPLGPVRKSLGWLSMLIYLSCITINPIYSIIP